MSCSSFVSQIDVANRVFTPAAALSTDIGLCLIDEINRRVGILMVRNLCIDNGSANICIIDNIWGSVRVSSFSIL